MLRYAAPDIALRVGACLQDETAWLPQTVLAESFGVKLPAIAKR